MEKMTHYIQAHFVSLFFRYKDAKIKIHQVAGGWLGVMTCMLTGKIYKITIEEVKSKVSVDKPLMFSDFEEVL